MSIVHDWKSLGEARIQRWPEDKKWDEKRPVTVKIDSWVGLSIGAKHTYLEITEARQEWWCDEWNGWTEVSCDSEAGGFHLRAEVYNEKEAVEIAKAFIAVMCSKKKHILKSNSCAVGDPKLKRWGLKLK